jgi:hypothetical protein
LGKQILKLLRGKVMISEIIGGIILVGLGIWIIVSHYCAIKQVFEIRLKISLFFLLKMNI